MNSTTPRLSFAAVKARAARRWPEILAALAPELREALERAPRHTYCPCHGGKHGDAFRFYRDFEETGGGHCNTCGPFPDGFAILGWITGKNRGQVLRDVAHYLDGYTVTATRIRAIPKRNTDPAVLAQNKARIERAWRVAKPARWSLIAQNYMSHRGLPRNSLPRSLRIHPGLTYFDDDKAVGRFPTLVAPVSAPDGALVSLHRTYLSLEGTKAPVPKPKKLMSASIEHLAGSAIRLQEASDGVLGLTEGIETALAVHAATGMPAWACVSCTLMESVIVPAHVGHVVIWADRDRPQHVRDRIVIPGQNAAERLAARLRSQGLRVTIMIPPMEIPQDMHKLDWLDVFVQFGTAWFTWKEAA